jgi:co-chaperonin GroES (HSP10)
MVDTTSLIPVNRRILIVPHFKKEKDDTGILLPEDYKPQEEQHIIATVVDVAPDCAPSFTSIRNSRERREVIVERSMIETIDYKDKKFHLILENYVVGVMRGRREV